MIWTARILRLSLVTCLAASASADPPPAPEGLLPIPDYTGDLWHRSRLTGDWGAWRTKLAQHGLQLDVDYTQVVQGIAQGGIEEQTDYGGHFDYVIQLDLMRMGSVPGALVTLHAESRYGSSVNGITGAVLPANSPLFFPLTDTLDEEVAITITSLNYTQFLTAWLAIVVGKMDTLDSDLNEFASGRGKKEFMNANFLFNSVLALRLPYSTLGAAVRLIPAEWFSLTASIINTKDSSTTSGFSDFDDGQSVSVEADSQYRLLGRPGGMNLGWLYSFNQSFGSTEGRLIFEPGEGLSISKKQSTWALYGSAWQYLWSEEESDSPIDLMNGIPDRRGIGVFLRAGIADKDTNPVGWSLSGGLGGRGIVPTRDDDVFGIGYYHTRIENTRFTPLPSDDDRACGFEAFYDAALTPAAHLAFDVQVLRPLPNSVDTAVVLGARLNLAF